VAAIARRVPEHGEVNAITRAVAHVRDRKVPIIDLTESNPTNADIPYPDGLLLSLVDPRAMRYAPDPMGLRSAREAIAADIARRGTTVDPAHLVLSASTSEAYSWLFKLLCDPGTSVAVPQPSYPLFEHLTRLEGVRATYYALDFHGRWAIDFDSLERAPFTTRAVLVVSPNNPTGSYVSATEVDRLVGLCRERRWALIVDEVFADYPLETADPVVDIAVRADVLTFSLGGASKALGLPQVKLAWTHVGGPAADRDRALLALEMIADTFLSVSTPVQVAAPSLLTRGAAVRAAIRERTAANLRAARMLAQAFPACDLLPVEGGWSAVLRVPRTRSEEALVLALLDEERILVHPGYYFDLPHEAFLIVSLLPEGPRFADAFGRLLRFVTS